MNIATLLTWLPLIQLPFAIVRAVTTPFENPSCADVTDEDPPLDGSAGLLLSPVVRVSEPLQEAPEHLASAGDPFPPPPLPVGRDATVLDRYETGDHREPGDGPPLGSGDDPPPPAPIIPIAWLWHEWRVTRQATCGEWWRISQPDIPEWFRKVELGYARPGADSLFR